MEGSQFLKSKTQQNSDKQSERLAIGLQQIELFNQTAQAWGLNTHQKVRVAGMDSPEDLDAIAASVDSTSLDGLHDIVWFVAIRALLTVHVSADLAQQKQWLEQHKYGDEQLIDSIKYLRALNDGTYNRVLAVLRKQSFLDNNPA